MPLHGPKNTKVAPKALLITELPYIDLLFPQYYESFSLRHEAHYTYKVLQLTEPACAL